jgi:hypothetical protein
MLKRFGVVLVAAASLGLAAVPVHAQVSKDVQKCQDGTSKALAKFLESKTKCAGKCIATQRKASSPAFSGCFAPYTDPTASACISGTLKAADAKGGAAIAKVCAAKASCPLCYASNPPGATRCTDSSGGNPWIQTAETTVDVFGPLVYCVEHGGTVPSKADAKCEDGISKALVKLVGAQGKCYRKCNDNITKGKIPGGSCTPLYPSDAATYACLFGPKGAEAKSAAAIDKACPTFPTCAVFTTGFEWTVTVESDLADDVIPQIFCGSPSGAFLN